MAARNTGTMAQARKVQSPVRVSTGDRAAVHSPLPEETRPRRESDHLNQPDQ